MPQKNRTQLKDYFKTNDKPTQAQFIDLIDSMFTLLEDGGAAIKTMLHGLPPANRLTKSAVRGADIALNKRGEGDLGLTSFISTNVVDVLKGDFWVQSGPATPRGGLTLNAGEWVVAKIDNADPSDFGSASNWWRPAMVVTDGYQTLNNKRITPRVLEFDTVTATPSINCELYDAVDIKAMNAAITNMSTNFSGTPTNFQKIKFRIKGNGSGLGVTWGSKFTAIYSGISLITTTTGTKTFIHEFEYHANRTIPIWVLINSVTE
jgi:hypothetical protein